MPEFEPFSAIWIICGSKVTNNPHITRDAPKISRIVYFFLRIAKDRITVIGTRPWSQSKSMTVLTCLRISWSRNSALWGFWHWIVIGNWSENLLCKHLLHCFRSHNSTHLVQYHHEWSWFTAHPVCTHNLECVSEKVQCGYDNNFVLRKFQTGCGNACPYPFWNWSVTLQFCKLLPIPVSGKYKTKASSSFNTVMKNG